MENAIQMLSLEEERALIYRAQVQGDVKARDKLVLAHRGLVRKIARSYRIKNTTLDADDFFQTGVLGLYDALLKFDPEKSARFATYARFCIHQKILAECGGSTEYTIPPQTQSHVKRVMKERHLLLEKSGGREPTLSELVERTLLPINEVRRSLVLSRASFRSFDSSLGNENEGTFGMMIPDTTFLDPDTALLAKEELRRARGYLQALVEKTTLLFPRKTSDIFFRRHALVSYSTKQGLRDISLVHGLSLERVRQIVVVCWVRLKKSNPTYTEGQLEHTRNVLLHVPELIE